MSIDAKYHGKRLTHRKEEADVYSYEAKPCMLLIKPIDSGATEDKIVAGQKAEENGVNNGHVQ